MQRSKPAKVIIDTNLWISFIISKKLNLLDSFLFAGEIRLLFSQELIKEIEQTISKPKLKRYFGPNALEDMLSSFEPFIDLIAVNTKVEICRDVKDNFLLSLAKDGKADFLLTGDKDLLELNLFAKTKIITITSFITEIKNSR